MAGDAAVTARRADDPSVTVRIRPDLIERMDKACKDRLIGRRLLIESALEQLLDEIEEVQP